MPLKFNPFTGTLDYIGVGKEEVTNENIKPAAGIEESKLSLPEVIKKLTVQTVEAEKKFETPQPAEELVAKSSAIPIIVKSGKGGNSSNTGTAIGGPSGKIEIITGEGGQTPGALKEDKGASSGSLTIKSGLGGEANAAGAERNAGGSAGESVYTSGPGGLAKGGSISAKGGKGGTWQAGGGRGGNAEAATQTNEGGAGAEAVLRSGTGGKAEKGEKAIGGNAGVLLLESGGGGTAALATVTNTSGSGGPVRVLLGEGGGSVEPEAKSGVFQIYGGKVEPTKLRLEITPTGFAKFQKSLGLWEVAPPAAKPAEIKPEEITVKALMEKLNTLHKEYGLTS